MDLKKYRVTKGQSHSFYRKGKLLSFGELQEFEATDLEVSYAIEVGTVAPIVAPKKEDKDKK